MAENSRIEDLRKRYHENPRRFFAPLANEYRKSGFLDRALLLCQKHVPEQPENMNGLVVYGQTLFELGQPDAAREPFEQALKLDPENLIALRHLGDIARLGGDVPAAKGWYEKVLELDRRNDEVLDLLAQLGGDSEPVVEAPSARPSTAASSLVSVAPTVSVSGGPDLGMIDLDAPATPPPAPKPAAGKGATVVINAQALADRDRREAEGAPITKPVAAVPRPATPPAAATADLPLVDVEPSAPRPSKRASLLDIDFDFSETVEVEPPKPVPAAPVLGAEAAEYGFADEGIVDTGAGTLLIEPTAAGDALHVETSGDVAPLALEPTIIDAPSAPAPTLPAGDFELAEFNANVSPLAGLEATEFTSEQVAPISELEADSTSLSVSSVAPLAGLDRPDVTVDDVAPVAGLDVAPALSAEPEPAGFAGLADLPLLEDPSAAPPAADREAGSVESPSARHKPRMTKSDLASLPLLADFGLEDDPLPAEPASAASARSAKATPTFVTETMAALYVKQGLLPEAIGVYRQLVEAAPGDAGLKAKLAELERMHAQESAPKAAAPDIEMPEFEVPADATEPEPAAANAAMSGLSFGGIGLQGQGSPTPIVTPAVPAGPTAREFFGNFARRAAVAAALSAAQMTPSAQAMTPDAEPVTAISTTGSGWPLDALFGAATDVRDLHAAEVLASVGSFEGPDGGTGIESMLSPSAEPSRRAVPRASEMLKFDQFFSKPGTNDPAAPPVAPSTPGDDDLDHFQGWLKGLRK